MMEFKMLTDLQAAMPQEISFNFEELKKELADRLQYYNGLIVTEDTIKESKEDRAKLNKLREAIETRRKEVKKEVAKPYIAFEAKVKELTALIDEPISEIDRQLKAYDEIRKEEKQKSIEEFYNVTVDPYLKTVIPLQRIQQPDWLNATKKEKQIQMEIIEALAKVKADLHVLNTMATDAYSEAVRAKYMETLDITTALAYRNRLQESTAAFSAANQAEGPQQPTQAEEPARGPQETEKQYSLRLSFYLTMKQANALKKFLEDNNIQHEKI